MFLRVLSPPHEYVGILGVDIITSRSEFGSEPTKAMYLAVETLTLGLDDTPSFVGMYHFRLPFYDVNIHRLLS